MALLDRSHVDTINVSQMLKIGRYNTRADGKTYFDIQITIGRVTWVVKRRYSEFADLHEILVKEYNIAPNLLPSKHAFAKQNEHFLRRRQSDLEVYLLTLWHHLRCFPIQLAEFLKFHQYEVHYMCEKLAQHLYTYGEQVLTQANVQGYPFEMTPIQVYAVAQRLKLAEPTCDSDDPTRDVGHILDVLSQLKALKIKGLNSTVGTSNMNMNDFHIDMSLFKAIDTLYLENCNPASLILLDTVRSTCRTLKVDSSLVGFRQLLCTDVDFQWSDFFLDNNSNTLIVNLRWNVLEHADFSCNSLAEIDNSIALLGAVRVLDLKRNQIETLPGSALTHLANLEILDISYNRITQLDNLYTKLGNIKVINLCGNQVASLEGLSKLYSLEELDASNNQLETLGSIEAVCRLPCMQKLDLRNNPVQQLLDYRIRVLSCFDELRVPDVELDKAGKPTQAEVDKVAVLGALRKASQTSSLVSLRDHRKHQTSGRPSAVSARSRIAVGDDMLDNSSTGSTAVRPINAEDRLRERNDSRDEFDAVDEDDSIG